MRAALLAKNMFLKKILPYPGVVGLGVGLKQVAGKDLDLNSVKIYVQTKLPMSKIDPRYQIPATLGSIPTDIVETGKIFSHGWGSQLSMSAPQSGRVRPVLGGYSIGSTTITAGTCGGLVTDSQDNNKVVAISNNHVFADRNTNAIGIHIVQPGIYDRGQDPADEVATLKRFVPIDFGFGTGGGGTPTNPTFPTIPPNLTDTVAISDYIASVAEYLKSLLQGGSNQNLSTPDHMNTVDVAVATPISQMMFSRSIAGIGVPGTSIDPSIGMTVVKSGRTTGITTGKISDTDLTVTIDYGTSPSGELNATFDDTILISGTGFSAGGDSGSRVMKNSSTHETVGLLFAGGSNSTIICKAKNIESQMGVRF